MVCCTEFPSLAALIPRGRHLTSGVDDIFYVWCPLFELSSFLFRKSLAKVLPRFAEVDTFFTQCCLTKLPALAVSRCLISELSSTALFTRFPRLEVQLPVRVRLEPRVLLLHEDTLELAVSHDRAV